MDNGLPIVTRFGHKNIVDVSLRVTVVQREPARLHLNHQAMSGQEDMVRIRQIEPETNFLVGRDRLWIIETLIIAAAKDITCYHQLIPTQLVIAAKLIPVY